MWPCSPTSRPGWPPCWRSAPASPSSHTPVAPPAATCAAGRAGQAWLWAALLGTVANPAYTNGLGLDVALEPRQCRSPRVQPGLAGVGPRRGRRGGPQVGRHHPGAPRPHRGARRRRPRPPHAAHRPQQPAAGVRLQRRRHPAGRRRAAQSAHRRVRDVAVEHHRGHQLHASAGTPEPTRRFRVPSPRSRRPGVLGRAEETCGAWRAGSQTPQGRRTESASPAVTGPGPATVVVGVRRSCAPPWS